MGSMNKRRARTGQRSPSRSSRRLRRRRRTLALCALVMILSLAYIIHYEHTRREIQRANDAFSAMYDAPEISAIPSAENSPTATDTPTPAPWTMATALPSPEPTETASPRPTVESTATASPRPTPEPTATASPRPTVESTATASPRPTPEPTATASPRPTPEPTATASPRPTATPTATASPTSIPSPTLPLVADIPLTPTEGANGGGSHASNVASASAGLPAVEEALPRATADADTLVMALETPPPVQESFRTLLETNPETVGFLTLDDVLSLPVVQRPYDNEYYLTHSFDLSESIGGTLFLDGANLLVPEDDCLIVYGHNMRNGTMFQPLTRFEKTRFLGEHPLLRFDTLYENRVWVPFAALTLTADTDSDRYLDIRQFTFDEMGFDLFVTSLRALSAWQSPVEVEFGDPLLLLVTCEYTHNNGRFVLALRAQRPYESELQLRSQVQASR